MCRVTAYALHYQAQMPSISMWITWAPKPCGYTLGLAGSLPSTSMLSANKALPEMQGLGCCPRGSVVMAFNWLDCWMKEKLWLLHTSISGLGCEPCQIQILFVRLSVVMPDCFCASITCVLYSFDRRSNSTVTITAAAVPYIVCFVFFR